MLAVAGGVVTTPSGASFRRFASVSDMEMRAVVARVSDRRRAVIAGACG